MTELRWGILATGFIADLFTNDLRVAGLNPVAVGSRSQESADTFAARYNIPRAHASYEALVSDPEVDIIYVSTPHPMHHANTKLALEHGKHVLVEKAFTVNRAEAEDLQRIAAERGLLIMEAMWTRYLPHMVRIREIIAAGTLGEIRAVMADHMQSLPHDPAHRINAMELGGGALLDLAIYPISFIWDILGAPEKVHAIDRKIETGADSELATVMSHAGGSISTSLSSSRSAGPNSAAIVGTEARIEIDHVWYEPSNFRLIASDGTVLEEFNGRMENYGGGRGMQFQAIAAERYVADGTLDSDLLPVAETVAIMGCLDEIRGQIGLEYPSAV